MTYNVFSGTLNPTQSSLSYRIIWCQFCICKCRRLFQGCLSIFSARHDWSPPRPVTLTRRQSDQELGFTVRGEAPVIVATVDHSSPAQVPCVYAPGMYTRP